MNALWSFAGTTRLVLAHVSKAAADQLSGAARPYGSVFVRNLARSAWELRRAEEAGPDELLIAAYHRKSTAGAGRSRSACASASSPAARSWWRTPTSRRRRTFSPARA